MPRLPLMETTTPDSAGQRGYKACNFDPRELRTEVWNYSFPLGREQANSNTREQFAASPDLPTELVCASIEALDAHEKLSTQPEVH